MLYVFAAAVFALLIFNKQGWIWSLGLTITICSGFLIYVGIQGQELIIQEKMSLIAWIAIMSNLILLVGVMAFLVPKLFDGIQSGYKNQLELTNQLERERKALQNSMYKLNKKNREMEQFAYRVSQEMNEPLRLIQVYLRRIHGKYSERLDEKGRLFTNLALQGIEKLKTNLIGLLVYSKSGKWIDRPRLIDLKKLVEEIWTEYQIKHPDVSGKISFGNLPQLVTYPQSLRVILEHLIYNAFNHCRKQHYCIVEINMESENENWKLKISDNGHGIPEQYQDQIFDIYFKSPELNNNSGVGLGLAISKKLIDQMGGEIFFESIAGKGTTFYILLPVMRLETVEMAG